MPEITSLQENRLLRDTVSPMYCQELLGLGLTNVHTIYWRLFPDREAKLWSYQFDPLHLYEETDQLLYELSPASNNYRAIAAFSAGDMISALPDIIITSVAKNNYEAGIDEQYGDFFATAPRMPDALAKLLIKLLNANVISAAHVNKMLLQNM